MNLSNSTLVDCVTQPTLRCAEDSSTFQEVAADLVSKVFDIPIFFSPSMVADANSFSPSPSKPLSAIQSWAGLGINLHEIPSTPATPEQFYLAHDKTFVDEILNCTRRNGFGQISQEVSRSLPYTTGAMLSAARHAHTNGLVAVAPVSGFHHAGWDHCGGYCTFNGLMVTAQVLKTEGTIQRIGILDFDQHWGDGTDEIVKRLGLDSWVTHYSPCSEFGTEATAGMFVRRIPELMERFRDTDLILYQAGADPHLDDPLGGWLTTKQLYERDRAVFKWCRSARIPVAWNLAGGYQTPFRRVLDIHDNTMIACSEVYGSAGR